MAKKKTQRRKTNSLLSSFSPSNLIYLKETLDDHRSRFTIKRREFKELATQFKNEKDIHNHMLIEEKRRRQTVRSTYKQRFSDLKEHIWEVHGIPEFAPKEVKLLKNKAIVPSEKINRMEAIKEKFTEEVRLINEVEATKQKPNFIHISKEQEKMLFSTNTATNVIAGAGSGKSTTLILRVILLHKHMDIPFDKITVCTFTVESKREFIDSLITRLRQFGQELSYNDARAVVRTFHSLAYEIHNKLGNKSKSLLYDFKSQKPADDDSYGVNIENLMQPQEDNSEEVSEKLELMVRLYKELYTEKGLFRQAINKLFKSSLEVERQLALDNKECVGKICGWIRDYENTYIEFCSNYWQQRHPEILNRMSKYLVTSNQTEIVKISEKTFQFQYHYYLPKSNAKICLSVKNNTLRKSEYTFGEKKQAVSKVEYYRRIVLLDGSANYYLVDDINKLLCFLSDEEFELERYVDTIPVPDFSYVCEGDFPAKSDNRIDSLLVSEFSKLIDFSYSIGKPLYTLSAKQLNLFCNKGSKVTESDQLFLKLAYFFHKSWISRLESKQLTTFDDVFHRFGTPSDIEYNKLDIRLLGKLQHLLIDEFQDISPIIAKFLNELKKQLHQNQLIKDGTLMSVGDDNQSIYGWRGSSPQYILNYKSCFDLSHDEQAVKLESNYRCSSKVLNLGAKILDKLPKSAKSDKKIKHARPDADTPLSCVELHPPILKKKNKSAINFELATQLLQNEANKPEITPNNPIYLLCISRRLTKKKSSPTWYAAIERLKKQKKVKVLTVHASKGLEAQTVFFVGDAVPPNSHPIRDVLCQIANIKGGYTRMQTEEKYRVAYVGVTRAKNRLFWFAESLESKSNLLASLFPKNVN
ncbi:UvrD-helicase domain-containing protein [Pseudoalteromonas ostreae]|uniref:UvrD-helicase domain-containing protein n=1 Tax=Pseudoalteromonas ostreae TaxID=2774154 RepID=UPI001B3685A7|nr:UvrD-helicase domain-containing protein [Pseudoalteromonas ostreae]